MAQRLKNKGSALLTALLIMVLAATIAIYIAVDVQVEVSAIQGIADADRAQEAGDVLTAWAKGTVIQFLNQKRQDKSAVLPLPQIFPKRTIGGDVVVEGQLSGGQAFFNINAITKPSNTKRFIHLMHAINSNTQIDEVKIDVYNLRNFMLAVTSVDDYYTRLDSPYRSAKQPLYHISELRLVKGFDAKLYQALRPYLIALPTSDFKINLNAIDAKMLAVMDKDIGLTKAKIFIDCRDGVRGFESMKQARRCLQQANISITDDIWTVDESYYVLSGVVTVGRKQFHVESLLRSYRDRMLRYQVEVLWETH